MTITLLTLFPDMLKSFFDLSIIKRAQEKGFLNINFVNIRDFASDKYRTVDDHPYGGGVGMVMKVDVIDRALQYAKQLTKVKSHTVLMDPKGTTYSQKIAVKYAKIKHLILIAGHYEGVDARVDELVNEKISIGSYVLTGGELPQAIIVDSVTRLLPGVLKDPTATQSESFMQLDALEPPHYTRPSEYKNMKVPPALLSGDPKKITLWKKDVAKTLK